MHANVATHATEWVRIAGGIKQLPDGSPLLGEEWIGGPWAVLGYTHALADTLDRLAEGRDVLAGHRMRGAPGARLAIDVLPHNVFDKLLLNGFSAQVWMQPGVTPEQTRAGAGLGQRTPSAGGGVGVVLGAGNITSIPPLDVLYELVRAQPGRRC